ncbi:MAG: SRPBCC domain-containing protein [Myxococcales bacterium]|nr:SRPBCC domain-containing protein [Thermoleophilia bacterium]MDH4283157.1 SRPBCC domain-containing protein [Myxococcales bacterium]
MSRPRTLSVAVDHILPAAPETVFRALTEPDLYARWMGPEGSTTTVQEMNVVPGGQFAFVVSLPNGVSVRLSGTYLEVDPPRRLVHTWQVEGEEAVTTVTIGLNPFDAETHVVLTHEGFTDEIDLLRNKGGWEHQLDRLARLLETDLPDQ